MANWNDELFTIPSETEISHPIRMPTEADGFTAAEIAAISAKRSERRQQGTSLVGE